MYVFIITINSMLRARNVCVYVNRSLAYRPFARGCRITIKHGHSDSVIAYYTRWYAVHSVPTFISVILTSRDVESCIYHAFIFY